MASVTFRSRCGDLIAIDMRPETLALLGVTPHQRVRTNKGKATLIGVGRDRNLEVCVWFLLDADARADKISHFGSWPLTKTALEEHNIYVIDDDASSSESGARSGGGGGGRKTTTTCPLKPITFRGRTTKILTQNYNGPCPLIALMNCLILNGSINIKLDSVDITLQECAQTISTHIKATTGETSISLNPNTKPISIEELLIEMISGMDVNFSFLSVSDFAMTPHVALFALAEIDIVHQWLADPLNFALREALTAGSPFYDDVTGMIAARALTASQSANTTTTTTLTTTTTTAAATTATVDANSSSTTTTTATTAVPIPISPRPPISTSTNAPPTTTTATTTVTSATTSTTTTTAMNSNAALNAARDVDSKLTDEQFRVIKQFFDATSTKQMTNFGAETLKTHLRPDTPSVLFFNNHFFVVVLHSNHLYALVTDDGYRTQSTVIWERLSSMTEGRSTHFYDEQFHPTLKQNQDRALSAKEEILSAMVREEANMLVRGSLPDLKRLYADNCVHMESGIGGDLLQWRVVSHGTDKMEKLLQRFRVLNCVMTVHSVDVGRASLSSSNNDEDEDPDRANDPSELIARIRGGIVVVDVDMTLMPQAVGNLLPQTPSSPATASHKRFTCSKTFQNIGGQLRIVSEMIVKTD